MMTRRRLLGMAAAIPFVAVTAVPRLGKTAATVTVEHVQGRTEVPVNPRTVLVFDLAALDTLDALGVAVRGVPGGAKPAHLEKYNGPGHVTVGTFFEPDYETVNAEAPDLIICGGRTAPKYEALSRIAPTLDLTIEAASFLPDAWRNARLLGRLFGKEAEAEARLAGLEAAMDDLRAVARGAGRGLLVLTTGGKMSAYGPGSRFGILHDAYGIPAALPDLRQATHGQAISFEVLLEVNPDWLFVIDRDAAIGREGQPARAYLDNDIVRRTSAWQKGHVVYLDGADWYLAGGGLTSLRRTVDDLKAALARG